MYHESVYADIVVNKFWYVTPFFSQQQPEFIANITSKNVSRVRT